MAGRDEDLTSEEFDAAYKRGIPAEKLPSAARVHWDSPKPAESYRAVPADPVGLIAVGLSWKTFGAYAPSKVPANLRVTRR